MKKKIKTILMLVVGIAVIIFVCNFLQNQANKDFRNTLDTNAKKAMNEYKEKLQKEYEKTPKSDAGFLIIRSGETAKPTTVQKETKTAELTIVQKAPETSNENEESEITRMIKAEAAYGRNRGDVQYDLVGDQPAENKAIKITKGHYIDYILLYRPGTGENDYNNSISKDEINRVAYIEESLYSKRLTVHWINGRVDTWTCDYRISLK